MDHDLDLPPGPGRPPRWRLPFGILAIAVLRLLDALGVAGIALGIRVFTLEGLPSWMTDERVVTVAGLTWAGATILGVVGLLLLQRWGWALTMAMVGVGLAFSLLRVVIGAPDYLELLLLVVSAFYLNQRDVRALAAPRRERDPRTDGFGP